MIWKMLFGRFKDKAPEIPENAFVSTGKLPPPLPETLDGYKLDAYVDLQTLVDGMKEIQVVDEKPKLEFPPNSIASMYPPSKQKGEIFGASFSASNFEKITKYVDRLQDSKVFKLNDAIEFGDLVCRYMYVYHHEYVQQLKFEFDVKDRPDVRRIEIGLRWVKSEPIEVTVTNPSAARHPAYNVLPQKDTDSVYKFLFNFLYRSDLQKSNLRCTNEFVHIHGLHGWYKFTKNNVLYYIEFENRDTLSNHRSVLLLRKFEDWTSPNIKCLDDYWDFIPHDVDDYEFCENPMKEYEQHFSEIAAKEARKRIIEIRERVVETLAMVDKFNQQSLEELGYETIAEIETIENYIHFCNTFNRKLGHSKEEIENALKILLKEKSCQTTSTS